jgi:ribosomal protein S12 methylthiotransferase accessory factor YcaO
MAASPHGPRQQPDLVAWRRLLEEATVVLPAPDLPGDGDCLTWAPAVARRLNEQGFAAQAIDVAGWVDEHLSVLAFLHRTVLVAAPAGAAGHGDPTEALEDAVVDVTARQFDPRLPARWLTGWRDYQDRLARAARVSQLTRWPSGPACAG